MSSQTFKMTIKVNSRFDMVLSQAITIVSTALMAALERSVPEGIAAWASYSPLVTIFSFLSCHKDEKGMLEDMSELWASFYNRVKFRFIPATSSVRGILFHWICCRSLERAYLKLAGIATASPFLCPSYLQLWIACQQNYKKGAISLFERFSGTSGSTTKQRSPRPWAIFPSKNLLTEQRWRTWMPTQLLIPDLIKRFQRCWLTWEMW